MFQNNLKLFIFLDFYSQPETAKNLLNTAFEKQRKLVQNEKHGKKKKKKKKRSNSKSESNSDSSSKEEEESDFMDQIIQFLPQAPENISSEKENLASKKLEELNQKKKSRKRKRNEQNPFSPPNKKPLHYKVIFDPPTLQSNVYDPSNPFIPSAEDAEEEFVFPVIYSFQKSKKKHF